MCKRADEHDAAATDPSRLANAGWAVELAECAASIGEMLRLDRLAELTASQTRSQFWLTTTVDSVVVCWLEPRADLEALRNAVQPHAE